MFSLCRKTDKSTTVFPLSLSVSISVALAHAFAFAQIFGRIYSIDSINRILFDGKSRMMCAYRTCESPFGFVSFSFIFGLLLIALPRRVCVGVGTGETESIITMRQCICVWPSNKRTELERSADGRRHWLMNFFSFSRIVFAYHITPSRPKQFIVHLVVADECNPALCWSQHPAQNTCMHQINELYKQLSSYPRYDDDDDDDTSFGR